MRDVDVVVLSKFPEIVEGFRKSVDADAPELKKCVVHDAPDSEVESYFALGDKWCGIFSRAPFKIARNANLGWKSCDGDIIYAGDDTRIIEPDTILRLRQLAEANPDVGILAPRIKGQDNQHPGASTIVPFVPFVFVLIKRSVIDKVGYLDERFEGYGAEDIEYCYRARRDGFKVAYANNIWIQHGHGEHKWGSTFKRLMTEDERQKQDRANWTRFAEKYGFPDDQTKIMQEIRKL